MPASGHLGKTTIRQFASKHPGGSYHMDYTKSPLPPLSQDPKPSARNPVVVLPVRQAHRAIRPLPRIPSSKQTQAHPTTIRDAERQSLHVDDLNTAPPKPLSKMEKALLRRIEFGVDHSGIPLS